MHPLVVHTAVHTIAATPLPTGAGVSAAYQRHVIVYPNRGELWDASAKRWYVRRRPARASTEADSKASAARGVTQRRDQHGRVSPSACGERTVATPEHAEIDAEELFTPDAAEWIALAELWRSAGAEVIGGCCRTTPDTIKMLSTWSQSVPDRGPPGGAVDGGYGHAASSAKPGH